MSTPTKRANRWNKRECDLVTAALEQLLESAAGLAADFVSIEELDQECFQIAKPIADAFIGPMTRLLALNVRGRACTRQTMSFRDAQNLLSEASVACEQWEVFISSAYAIECAHSIMDRLDKPDFVFHPTRQSAGFKVALKQFVNRFKETSNASPS
jgi:hypothetical protein